ncbi:MAG: hypothetical protein COT32_01050, partial [Candidatus Nealsonbacteria bacterium CG08_land_8_20_14_0_20_36_22]
MSPRSARRPIYIEFWAKKSVGGFALGKENFFILHMSLKDNFKKYFSKKRHIAAVVIVILLTIIGLNN